MRWGKEGEEKIRKEQGVIKGTGGKEMDRK